MGKRSKTKNKPSQQTLSGTLPDLQQALLDSKAENKELAAENAALKEQIASKELNWEQEKKKLLDEKDSLVSTLFMARNDLDSLVKTVESERANAKDHFEELEIKLTEQRVQKVNEMKHIFKKSVIDINTEWERQLDTRLKEAAAEKTSQIIQEKDDEINSLRHEMMALVERNLATLRAIETEFQESETEWQTKHEALEDCLGRELAAKQESFRKTQELQEHGRVLEESWLAKEEEWLSKASKLEEDIKLLIVQNIELQELALKTDKEKAKMKKEEERITPLPSFLSLHP
ncbi:protein Spindly-like [Morone saxatilis]|uniref:protein Spindly-like n=1 Tax=Morone saxatilis TaxID=34816 RepID=UPI0015E237DB|nr:protein Spindly-like [Morone saxatilis]